MTILAMVVYLLSRHFEMLDCFECFVTEIENQIGRSIKVLRTDRVHEYLFN